MNDPNQIRINELARELEVKAKAIIDYLPEAGVTEKKTHSSSIELAAAEKVRKHFRDLADAEAAADAAAAADKAAREAAAKTVRSKPQPVAPAPVAGPAAPPAAKPPVPAAVPAGLQPAAAPVPAAKPPIPGAPVPPAAKPGTTPAAVKPAATGPPVAKPVAPGPPVTKPHAHPAPPPHAPAAPKHVTVATQPAARIPTRPGSAPPVAGVRPATPPAAARPAAAGARPASSAPGARPAQTGLPPSRFPQRPGAPGRPMPARPGQRPMRPGGGPPLPEKLPPKAEPGKPIYERKPAARARPTIEKRFEEGERKLHPVRTRPGVVERRGVRVVPIPQPVAREPRGITITEGITVRELAGRVDVRAQEACTRMRARGAKVTDIVVLVVAADDGVMPQTQEAIDHAKAAGVPIVVAINKVDKPEAQAERVKRQLSDRGLMPEEWGGDTVMVEVSARQKKNLDKLLEMILLVADLRELKANPDSPATGTVLESRVDKGRGPVATVLVQSGTLHTGDVFICGAVYGKVRAMFDDRGRAVKQAGPSTPVEVLGLQSVPEAGDQFQVTEEARARHIVEYRQAKLREASLARSAGSRITLDQLHEQLRAGDVKELPIVIKADVQGSVEVLSEMLPKLSTDQVKLKIIHASVGAVSETDVLLASASNAIIIAFGVRPDRKAADLAQQENVDIRPHSVIYEVSDEIKNAMTGLLEPVLKETPLGHAEIRDTFRIKGVGTIAGSYVQDGILKRDAEVRVLRDGVVIYTGRVQSLRRFTVEHNEVRAGFECGVGISNFNDVKVGDILECYTMVKKLTVNVADSLRTH